MIEFALFIVSIIASIAGYGIVKRSKKIEDLSLKIRSISINIFD